MDKQDEAIVNLLLALDQLYNGRLSLAHKSITTAISLIVTQNKKAVDDEIVRRLEAKE